MGQNFLVNENTYRKIVDLGQITPEDSVIEVGPGLGILTEYIAQKAGRVIAVEKDRGLVSFLKNKFADFKNTEVVENDILKFDPESHDLRQGTYTLVGNIPYYLTSHLIRVVLESWPPPKLIIFMLQKEVAQRIVATPPGMSLLAVSVQYYADAKIIDKVSRSYFWPQPEVDSAIITIKPRIDNRVTAVENRRFFRVVKAGFAGKRKQLINTLSAGLKLPRTQIEKPLLLVDIDPKRRAETLTIKEWQKLTEAIYDLRNKIYGQSDS